MAAMRAVLIASACLVSAIDGFKEVGDVQWKPMAKLLVALDPSLAFNLVPPSAARANRRAAASSMMAGASKPKTILAPTGPLGGFKEYELKNGEYVAKDPEAGWLGDQSNSLLIKKFETGEEYLFFQNPTPKTGVQPDLPGFFSSENLGAIPGRIFGRAFSPQIAGSFAAGLIATILLAGPLTESFFPDGLPSVSFASREAGESSATGSAAPEGESFLDKLSRASQEAAAKRAEDAKIAEAQKLIDQTKEDKKATRRAVNEARKAEIARLAAERKAAGGKMKNAKAKEVVETKIATEAKQEAQVKEAEAAKLESEAQAKALEEKQAEDKVKQDAIAAKKADEEKVAAEEKLQYDAAQKKAAEEKKAEEQIATDAAAAKKAEAEKVEAEKKAVAAKKAAVEKEEQERKAEAAAKAAAAQEKKAAEEQKAAAQKEKELTAASSDKDEGAAILAKIRANKQKAR